MSLNKSISRYTEITDPNSKLTKRTINARGEVVQMVDAANGTTAYAYDPFGNLKSTTDPASNQITMGYDLRGGLPLFQAHGV